MPHLFVIAGHGAGDPGAVGNGYQEAERVRDLANRIKALGGNDVTLGDTNRNWYEDGGISSLNIPKDWAIIELHMDSSKDSEPHGGHVIIKAGQNADAYDNALANFIGSILPGRSQLIVGRSELANPNRAAAKGYNYRLVEFGFITNATDISIFNNNLDAIASGVLMSFGINAEPEKGLGAPVFVKQKETLDIGFNFSMPGNQGRFKWLLYDVAKGTWETLVDWTASNWISIKKDKSGAGYLVQCQLYDLDTKEAHLIDTKTVGTDAGTGTVINGTYAAYRSDGSILIGCSSNNADVNLKMKVYNCTTQKWFTQFDGQWASFTPDKGTNYIIQFEAHASDGTLLDYKAVGV